MGFADIKYGICSCCGYSTRIEKIEGDYYACQVCKDSNAVNFDLYGNVSPGTMLKGFSYMTNRLLDEISLIRDMLLVEEELTEILPLEKPISISEQKPYTAIKIPLSDRTYALVRFSDAEFDGKTIKTAKVTVFDSMYSDNHRPVTWATFKETQQTAFNHYINKIIYDYHSSNRPKGFR